MRLRAFAYAQILSVSRALWRVSTARRVVPSACVSCDASIVYASLFPARTHVKSKGESVKSEPLNPINPDTDPRLAELLINNYVNSDYSAYDNHRNRADVGFH